jgi:hypothetical protein
VPFYRQTIDMQALISPDSRGDGRLHHPDHPTRETDPARAAPPGGSHSMRTPVTASPATTPAIPHSAFAPPVNLNHQGHYVHWGFVQISAANIVMIVLIGVAFVVALFVPFPKPKGRDGE